MTGRTPAHEIMDDPALSEEEHLRALYALARMNRIGNTGRLLWREMYPLISRNTHSTLRALDIATGLGDIPCCLSSFAKAENVPLILTGCDISPRSVQWATEYALKQGLKDITFFRRDVLTEGVPDGYDIIFSSLFLHHLSDTDAARLLKEMTQKARKLVLVLDLARTPLSKILVFLATHLFSRSHVVHTDGYLSVRAAFTPGEIRSLALQAGIKGLQVRRCLFQRMLLRWEP